MKKFKGMLMGIMFLTIATPQMVYADVPAWQEVVAESRESTLLEKDEVTSKNILNDIENHRLILKENRHNEVDMWVSFFAFVFDLNFKSSYQFIKENDYIHRNMERLEIKEGLKEDMLFVEKTCQSIIEEKCCN